MKKLSLLIAFGAALSLASCGDKQEDTSSANASEAKAPPAVAVNSDFNGISGRWSTVSGGLPENRRLIIDIASNGRFTMDVRGPGAKGEAIFESGRGSATKNGELVIGTTESQPGAGPFLERYKKWTLDPSSGSITGMQNSPMEISKE